MRTEDLIKCTVGVIVSVVILTVLIPVLGTGLDDVRTTGENEYPYYYMDDVSGDFSISVDDGKIMSGSYDMSSYVTGGRTIIVALCDSFFITAYNTSGFIVNTSTSSDATTSITVHNGVASYTTSLSVDKTANVTGKLICGSETGKYGYYNSANVPTLAINEDTEIKGLLYNKTLANAELDPASISATILFKGTYDDLKSTVVVSESTITKTTISLKNDPVESNEDYLQITPNAGVLTSATTSDGKYSADTEISRIIIPMDYKYIGSLDNAIISIIDLIPLLIVVGLILGIVGIIAFKDRL